MRAMAIREFGGPERLQLMELPMPSVGPGEVLIRLDAAGVNPIDCKIRAGYFGGRTAHRARPHHFPVVLGWDGAGVIDRVGRDVTRFRPADRVYAHCLKPTMSEGTYAEYVAVPAAQVAHKPASQSSGASAGIPTAGLTAYQAIVDRLQLRARERILITAAAGGVGSFAVQIAADLGAYVIATASKPNHPYLQDLGAAEQIDYREHDVVGAVRASHPDGVEAILHCVDSDDIPRSAVLLTPGGRLRWLVGGATAHQVLRQDVDAAYVGLVEPRGEQLTVLANLIDGKRLCVPTTRLLRLEDAAEAHAEIETGHVRGKIVLNVSGD